MRQDMERRSRGRHHVVHDDRRVGCAADRLGAEEGHVGGPEPARRIGVPHEGRGQLAAGGATQVAALGDGRTQAEEDGLIDERLQAMIDDDGDQQMDRVRTEIDRRTDDRTADRQRRARVAIVRRPQDGVSSVALVLPG